MSKRRVRQVQDIVAVLLLIIGLALGGLALSAEFIGLDFTPGFGMVQMFQLLVALTSLTVAGFIILWRQRPSDAPRSLQADIGIRLAATGLVFAIVSGLSDLIGIGTHVLANEFERPHVGPLQLGGFLLGVISIVAGMFLFHTSRGTRQTSSMEFLIHNGDEEREEDGS